MESSSPQMYEHPGAPSQPGGAAPAVLEPKGKAPSASPPAVGDSAGELAQLTTSEISLDLQGLIDDAHFGDDNLFGDLEEAKKRELNHGYGIPAGASPSGSMASSGLSSPAGHDRSPPPGPGGFAYSAPYVPGSVHHGASYAGLQNAPRPVRVKQEPVDHPDYGRGRPGYGYASGTVSSTTPAGFSGPGPMGGARAFAPPAKCLPPQPQSTTGAGGGPKKRVNRNTDEYRKRRERNNVAVRKSREKAKLGSRETEERVKVLARENERMQKKVELLQEELSVLRSLFSNVGVLPEHVHRELSKHADVFAQQHNAMACT